MALISCPNCGKQISDKAAACPHCGAAQTPVTPTTPTPEPQQQPKGNGKKIAIGVAVAVLALLVALVVAIPLFFGHGGKVTAKPSSAPASVATKPAPSDAGFKIEGSALVKYTGPGGDVVIPDGVTSIEGTAFFECNSVTSVIIPNSVTEIDEFAFNHCTGLKSVAIPDSVTRIGGHAFGACSSLTSVVIPNGVTKIETMTFGGCTSLESVTIPDSVTEIDYGAFAECTSLELTIPKSVTKIDDDAFFGCSDQMISYEGQRNVTLNLDFRENLVANKYDVIILVDGKRIGSLEHGKSGLMNMIAQDGTHEVEFRVDMQTPNANGSYDKSTTNYLYETIQVSADETFSYNIKLTWKGIEVERLS